MRLCLVIPHWCPQAPEARMHHSRLLGTVISGVCKTAWRDPRALDFSNDTCVPAGFGADDSVDIFVVTTMGEHAISDGSGPPNTYEHVPIACDPQKIGWEAHQVLKDQMRGDYDWFGYLEDDILIQDSDFFRKLEWFQKLAGPDSVLLPWRFEFAFGAPFRKVYCDPPLPKDQIEHLFLDPAAKDVECEHLGRRTRFTISRNPVSGCFFLSREQMERWAWSSRFGEKDTSFFTPQVSAQALPVLRHFKCYKPQLTDADFFYVEHMQQEFVPQVGRKFQFDPPPMAKFAASYDLQRHQ